MMTCTAPFTEGQPHHPIDAKLGWLFSEPHNYLTEWGFPPRDVVTVLGTIRSVCSRAGKMPATGHVSLQANRP